MQLTRLLQRTPAAAMIRKEREGVREGGVEQRTRRRHDIIWTY
jgi:hypothetical protein